MIRPDKKEPSKTTLDNYRLASNLNIFSIGTFDERVTVLSQQIRALNLAWAMERSNLFALEKAKDVKRIAIVGGGFAGLTLAAGLLSKRIPCEISIFEARDGLLPLQQGSDSRWLHPYIYEWPEQGSESAVAMLPVLNWSAARASDVVVQVLSEWRRIFAEWSNDFETQMMANMDKRFQLYCNVRHLDIAARAHLGRPFTIEWVGEHRDSRDGAEHKADTAGAIGTSDGFDIVVLALGFGIEHNNKTSYWRNEMLGQPSLHKPRQSFFVSGQGDGALIDLLRLRISQFRQDRILDELFRDELEVVNSLQDIKAKFTKMDGAQIYEAYEELFGNGGKGIRVVQELRRRLRRDTEAVLGLRVQNIAELLHSKSSKTSFQNALLVYLLYKCGGFAPANSNDEERICEDFTIPPSNVVRRHGTDRLEPMRRVLDIALFDRCFPEIQSKGKNWKPTDSNGERGQPTTILWSGGYFGTPVKAFAEINASDSRRKWWRKEYLPGPTALFAASISSAVSGLLNHRYPNGTHHRVTFHRKLSLNQEIVLQQACNYAGRGFDKNVRTLGRTFPSQNATIGLAFFTRKIIRSKKGISNASLSLAMKELDLDVASYQMESKVSFLLAVPVIASKSEGPDEDVLGVLYLDSQDDGFWLDDNEVVLIVKMLEDVTGDLSREKLLSYDRIRNASFRGSLVPENPKAPTAHSAPEVAAALDILELTPPRANGLSALNFEHTELS